MSVPTTNAYAPRTFLEAHSSLASSTIGRKLRDVPVLDPAADVPRYLLDHPVSRALLGADAPLADAGRWVTHSQIASATGIPIEGARLLTDMTRLDAQVVDQLGAPLFEREAAAGAAKLAGLDPSRLLVVTPGTGLAIADTGTASKAITRTRTTPAPKRAPRAVTAAPGNAPRALEAATKRPAPAVADIASSVGKLGTTATKRVGVGAAKVVGLVERAPASVRGAIGAAAILGSLGAVDVAAAKHLPAGPTAGIELATVGGTAFAITRLAKAHPGLQPMGVAGKYAAGAGAAMVVASFFINQGVPS